VFFSLSDGATAHIALWLTMCRALHPFDSAGGACGFKKANQYPFMSMTSCGNEPLFKDGKGCGACYQVRYSTLHMQTHMLCSSAPDKFYL
jgi:hypothetical protein